MNDLHCGPSYERLSDAVGILRTARIKYHWVRSAEGKKVITHAETFPMRCLVWDPNIARPADHRRVLAVTIAHAEAAA